MKRFLTLFLSLNIIGSAFAGEEILTGKNADELYKGATLVRVVEGFNHPLYVEFSEKEAPADILAWVTENFEMPEGSTFRLTNEFTDNLGFTHQKYQQLLNGTKVEFSDFKVHILNGKVKSINGYLVTTAPSSSFQLSESAALGAAKNFVGANTYKWELPSEENFIKWEMDDANATFFPTGEMVYIPQNADFKSNNLIACWKFDIYAHDPDYRADVYVNASTGEIAFENNRIHTSDSVGVAHTGYSGTRAITADYIASSNVFRLREVGRGSGVQTFDALNGTSFGAAVDFFDSNNIWPDTLRLSYSTDAHWGAEQVYDYYLGTHGRNSYDGNGATLRSYVHFSSQTNNASWDGQRMRYLDGSGGLTPFTSLDICGHEMSHGVIQETANLIYQAESGALNESFADIFGSAVEHYAKPDPSNNWLLGEEVGFILRSMANPKTRNDPDTYFGDNWASLSGGDNGGVHTNSGVQNHWFYLLTMGGSGVNDNNDNFSVTGIGWAGADSIAYRNLSVYLSQSSNYADARFFAIQSAIDIYGRCTQQLESTVNAWYAVGVGDEYTTQIESDFSSTSKTSCTAPLTVAFFNESNYNGTNFQWNFGDGSSSTMENPVHTYTTPGSYTVTLTATGSGACSNSSDVMTKNNYVEIEYPVDVVLKDTIACVNTKALVYAGTNDQVYWYDSQTSIDPIYKGNPFVSNDLSANTTFYASAVIEAQVENVGPVDNTIGSGSSFNFDRALIFDVFVQMELRTVEVVALSSGERTIELRSSNNTVLQSKTVNLDIGRHTVDLYFDIMPGTDYRLGVNTGGTVALFRNNAGADYPYVLDGVMSITGSTANAEGYYYFFYNWEVKGEDCVGDRLPVDVTLDYSEDCAPWYTGIEESIEENTFSLYPNPTSGQFVLEMDIQESQQFNVEVMDINGQKVLDIIKGEIKAGNHRLEVDGNNLNSGLYFVRITDSQNTKIEKLMVE